MSGTVIFCYTRRTLDRLQWAILICGLELMKLASTNPDIILLSLTFSVLLSYMKGRASSRLVFTCKALFHLNRICA